MKAATVQNVRQMHEGTHSSEALKRSGSLTSWLVGSNWNTWKFQLKHLLLAKGLWSFLDGSDKLAEGAKAEARAEHKKKTQKAFSTIVLALAAHSCI